MSRVRFYLLVGILLIAPKMSEAAVTLSEVAWMGTTVSANDEWIELYNSGGEESVDGWIITDGMNLTIELTGTIAAGSYAVLERTDDDTVSGTAFLIYTGSLVNTGATLTLKRSDGSIVDQVAGGENWVSIGGDNVTKETAQYTSGGWVTAIATPGAVNTTDTNIEEEVDDENDDGGEDDTAEEEVVDETTKTSSTRNATPAPLKLVPGVPTVRINMPATVYVNQEVEAVATVSDIGKTIEQSMERVWNFGDLATATGKEVSHRFSYPGEYIVSVRATYKDFVAADKVVVKVLPMNFSVTTNAAGDIQLHNDAKYEIDVSGYSVRAGETVVFPEDTYMRANATITIPRGRLGLTDQIVIVSDEVGKSLVYFNPRAQQSELPVATAEVVAVASYQRAPLGTVPEAQINAAFRFLSEGETSSGTESVEGGSAPLAPTLPPVGNSLSASVASTQKQSPYPYLGLFGIIGIAILAVIFSRTKTADSTVAAPSVNVVEDDPFPFR